MTELIIDILSTLKNHGLNLDEQKAFFALECALDQYNFSKKSTELALTCDLQDKIKYFLACKKLERCSDGTLKNYFYMLRDFSDLINKPLIEISTLDIKKYVAEKSKQRKSIESIINCIKSFFQWAQDEEFITSNPAKRILSPKADKYIRDALTIEQVELCRNACNTPRERALFEFFLASGCRVSEISNLTYEEVLSGHFKVFGKGRKERYVFANKRSQLYIKQYINRRKDTNPYLFAKERAPYGPMSARAIQDEFQKIGKRCGVHLHPHILRHTFATRALENGAPLSIVQRWLGHSSANTTEIYAKNSAESIMAEYKRCVDY